MRKCWIMFIFLLLIVCVWCKRPNFVFILSDDQDFVLSGITPMKLTISSLANEGMSFVNAFVNSPICCPSRSSLLTGKFPHNTGVWNNSLSGNCSSRNWQENHEHETFPVFLKNAGYQTFYAGKYLNKYGDKNVGGSSHIPPGYDWWIGLIGNSKYYNYSLSINGTKKFFQDEYLTDLLKSYSIDFLNQHSVKEKPFFMMVSTPAPHAPFTPAARHSNEFPDAKAIRTPAFNHTPINKHWLLNLPPTRLPSDVTILDDIQKHRMQSLLAVDELVDGIIKKLKSLRILEHTFVILTSDNGFHIGQFGLPWDKRQPYDTDIRVPLIIRGPDIEKKSLSQQPLSLIDLAPTILDLAGVENFARMDGVSVKEMLFDASLNEERLLLIEYEGEGNSQTIDRECPWKGNADLAECSLENWCKCQDSRNNTYSCLRHISPWTDYKYCEFHDQKAFIESYNLRADLYELNNTQEGSSYYKSKLKEAKTCKSNSCIKILNPTKVELFNH